MPFTPQLTCPDPDDLFFIRKGYNGYSPCVKGSPEYVTGSSLANCVGYCWGMAAKREENVNCNIGFAHGCTWPDDAQKWINHPNGRQTGMTPQLGAIACWVRNDNKSGHVACVEQINSDGSCLCSESGYGLSIIFRTRTYPANFAKTNFTFQGFIYLNWPGDPPLPPSTDEPVLYPITFGDLQVGDKVRIIGKGAAEPDGQGGVAYGAGWVRYIQGIYEEGQYPFKVGRLNGGTTGYYKRSALELLMTDRLKIGDWVIIRKGGNSRSGGDGKAVGGIGWKRQILNILPDRRFPYRVGKDGRTTGYYKAASLEKYEGEKNNESHRSNPVTKSWLY